MHKRGKTNFRNYNKKNSLFSWVYLKYGQKKYSERSPSINN